MDEANKHGLHFAGHVPYAVSAVEASEAGQHSIEHLSGILLAASSLEEMLREMTQEAWTNRPEGRNRPRRNSTRLRRRIMLENFSPQKATALFAHFKRNQTWQTPTMTVLRNIAFLDEPQFRDDPRLKYLPTGVKARWERSAESRSKFWKPDDYDISKQMYQKQMELVGMLHRADVPLLAGSDVLNPYCLPGFSLHDELGLLVEAGLTPMAALQTATLNPAQFLGREQEFGTVQASKLADFVLLNANPLESIDHIKMIHAVVTNGRLLDRAALDGLLAEVEAKVKQSHLPPLPDDLKIIAPQTDVAPDVAAFSGKWAGKWAETLDHVLVVEKIEGRTVTFIYSWGVAAAWRITHPGYRRVTGHVDASGVLRGTMRNGAKVVYRLSPDQQSLSGEYIRDENTTIGTFKRK